MILLILHSSNKQNVCVRGCCKSGISIMCWGQTTAFIKLCGVLPSRRAFSMWEKQYEPRNKGSRCRGRVICCRSPRGRSYTTLSAPHPGSEGFQPVLPTFPWLLLPHHPTLTLADLPGAQKRQWEGLEKRSLEKSGMLPKALACVASICPEHTLAGRLF